MPTEFDEENNTYMHKVVTTISQGLIRAKHKEFAAKYLTQKYWYLYKFCAYNIYLTSNVSVVGVKILKMIYSLKTRLKVNWSNTQTTYLLYYILPIYPHTKMSGTNIIAVGMKSTHNSLTYSPM